MKHLGALVFAVLFLTTAAFSARAEATVLTILSGGEPCWEYDFLQQNPDIAIRHTDVALYGAALQTYMMTSDDCDIYVLTPGPLYAALRDKGYLLPIEDGAAADFALHALPYLQSVLMKNETVYAFPVPGEDMENVWLNMWAYDAEAWAQEQPGPLPATYAELLAMLIDWEANHADSPYRLCSASLGYDGLDSALFRAYIAQYEIPDAPLNFDTPAFRNAMELLKQFSEVYQPLDNRPALITPHGSYLTDFAGTGLAWLFPPVFVPGERPIVHADLQIYAINARTKHPAQALRYIHAAAAQHNDLSLLLMLDQPPKEIRQDKTVLVTQAQAAAVQDVLPYAAVGLTSRFMGGDHHKAMMNDLQQYLQGTLPLDRLIEKLNQRSEMVFLEDLSN